MEYYTFTVLVFLLLGVLGIIVMLEWRRRTDLIKSDQSQQTLSDCLASLQAIYSSNQSQMGQIANALKSGDELTKASREAQMVQISEALKQVLAALDNGKKSSSEYMAALTDETVNAIEKAAVHLESVLLQNQKAQDAAGQSIAVKISDVTQGASKELLAEVQRTTKAVHDLKASLEESVNFK